MSKQLVLISHGRFCEELKHSTEMIMGPQESIHSVAFASQKKDQKISSKKFLDTIKDFDDYLVFADLLGGTPCNVISRLIMEGQEIELYTGMNLPMVIEFINSSLIGADSNYQRKSGRKHRQGQRPLSRIC